MDIINKKLECFLLLKKRLRDNDIKRLISYSNQSIVRILRGDNGPKNSLASNDKKKHGDTHPPTGTTNKNPPATNEKDPSNPVKNNITKVADKGNKIKKEFTNTPGDNSVPNKKTLDENIQDNLKRNLSSLKDLAGFSMKNSHGNASASNHQKVEGHSNKHKKIKEEEDLGSKSPEIINDENAKTPSVMNDDEDNSNNAKKSKTPIISPAVVSGEAEKKKEMEYKPITAMIEKNKENSFKNIITEKSEIKKKEFDLVCLSQIENILTKIKAKYQPSPNSSSAKQFNEINKILQGPPETENKVKRIKQITEKSFLVLQNVYSIFEDDKKRENYLNEINQVLDVMKVFLQKTKANFLASNTNQPSWFKIFKLVHKYINSLFNLKVYNKTKIKSVICFPQQDNKMKNLVLFAKTYKSFMNSTQKLKEIIDKDDGERKRKKSADYLIGFLETEPNSIKYDECFSVSKKIIEFIFEYHIKD